MPLMRHGRRIVSHRLDAVVRAVQPWPLGAL